MEALLLVFVLVLMIMLLLGICRTENSGDTDYPLGIFAYKEEKEEGER